MLAEVASLLNRRGKDDLLGKLVLVSDHRANGGFLIHHFLSQALKDGHTVYLVSFAQSFIYYSSVAAKLGINLSRFQTSGQLVYVDCLSQLLDGKWVEPSNIVATPTNKDSSTITYTMDSDGTLRGLYKLLQSSLSCRTLQSPVCIVLDDLSILTSIGARTADIASFVKYCTEFISGPHAITSGYVITMVHCEGGRSGDGEEVKLYSRLLCHAHLHLAVNGMETGYCRDIQGKICVEWREPCPTPSDTPSTKHVQFKLSDKNVHFFAGGTSRVVL